MNSQVAIDASFLLKLFLPEDSSDQVEQLWRDWIESSVEIIAPHLIIYETSSVLRNKVFRGTLDELDASEIIEKMRHLDLSLVYTEEVLELAWEIGSRLKTSSLYDCFYLATAKLFRIPLWTSDKKLLKLGKREFPFVNLL